MPAIKKGQQIMSVVEEAENLEPSCISDWTTK
jgi:hypothetical protein